MSTQTLPAHGSFICLDVSDPSQSIPLEEWVGGPVLDTVELLSDQGWRPVTIGRYDDDHAVVVLYDGIREGYDQEVVSLDLLVNADGSYQPLPARR
jgi:hypothetical protein